MEQIIKSLLDTDLYKFKMHQFMYHKHRNKIGKYIFKCRDKDFKLTPKMLTEIKHQVSLLSNLVSSFDELDYLDNLKIFKQDYIDYLSTWRINLNYIKITSDEISVEGPLGEICLYDIYLLAIINEVYFKTKYPYKLLLASARHRLYKKIDNCCVGEDVGKYTFHFAEFGTRRRLSAEWQYEMVKLFFRTKNCTATSNVYIAKRLGTKPIGASGHEVIQVYEAIESIPLEHINYYFMQDWLKEYPSREIALSDTLTTDLFLGDFTKDLINQFAGVRNDSGDPFIWGDKLIEFYKHNSIDPKTKVLLFSNALSFDKAQELYDYFKDKALVSFGIGTFCSNDTFAKPLNIVMKLQYIDGKPVGKISDDIDKAVVPPEFKQQLLSVIK